MRYFLPLAVAGILGLMAWPLIDTLPAPALEVVEVPKSHWPDQSHLRARQVSWVGNESKRDAILKSAVWTVSKKEVLSGVHQQ